jgi:hypothetical protein
MWNLRNALLPPSYRFARPNVYEKLFFNASG